MRRYLLGLLFLAAFGSGALAAVTPNSVVTAQTPSRGIVQFLQGTDTAGTYKTLYTAGTNGSICKGLWMQSADSTTHVVTVQIVNSTVKYGGPTPTTTTASGGAGTLVAPQNLMSSSVWPGLPLDQNGNPYFVMVSGDTLQATFATALSGSGALIDAIAVCSDF